MAQKRARPVRRPVRRAMNGSKKKPIWLRGFQNELNNERFRVGRCGTSSLGASNLNAVAEWCCRYPAEGQRALWQLMICRRKIALQLVNAMNKFIRRSEQSAIRIVGNRWTRDRGIYNGRPNSPLVITSDGRIMG